jgi:hypothetical protein
VGVILNCIKMNNKIKETYIIILKDGWWPRNIGRGMIRFQLEELMYIIGLDEYLSTSG